MNLLVKWHDDKDLWYLNIAPPPNSLAFTYYAIETGVMDHHPNWKVYLRAIKTAQTVIETTADNLEELKVFYPELFI